MRSLVRDGAPLYELLRVVTEVGADLLVLGIRGRSLLALGTLGTSRLLEELVPKGWRSAAIERAEAPEELVAVQQPVVRASSENTGA